MDTNVPSRKAAGRLSREDQRKLGDILNRVYDDVIRQGVPDRFKALLQQLDEPAESGRSNTEDAKGGHVKSGHVRSGDSKSDAKIGHLTTGDSRKSASRGDQIEGNARRERVVVVQGLAQGKGTK